MFPPNLQKNIQELERQISLLETECEHMEAEKQEPAPPGPCISTSSYSPPRVPSHPPEAPRIYSASCSHFRTTKEKLPKPVEAKCPQEPRNNRFKETATVCDKTTTDDELSHERQKHSQIDQKPNTEREMSKTCKRSIGSIQEVSETSDENLTQGGSSQKVQPKKEAWTELFIDQNFPKNPQEGSKTRREISQPKLSLDEKYKKSFPEVEIQNWPEERPVRPKSQRRPRSARTKTNTSDGIPLDLNTPRTNHEKEIQCVLWDEQKGQFFSNLDDSLEILYHLIGELKTKISREKRDDVLKDMQKTLLKISGIKYMNSPPMTPYRDPTEADLYEMKNTLTSLKQFCQEVSDEKRALADELSVKNRILNDVKRKEKEYLSLISSLKYHLDKMKEEVDEGGHAKQDLKLLKLKLQEEAKVIEALKKSHEKMQELVENYVLENDKLRAQVKIAKLESHKYNVLLAGKEAEINKYKQEIGSFQRQITQQLSLLRSKATENEVEETMKAITDQNFLGTEPESAVEKDDYNETKGSSSTLTEPKNSPEDPPPHPETSQIGPKAWEVQSDSSRLEPKQVAEAKTGSNESDGDVKRQFGLERVLSSSKNLRASINELLEDIRRESSEMYWMSPSNSCLTSSRSVLISTSSDDATGND